MKLKTSHLVVVTVAALLSACAGTGSHRLKDPSVAAMYGAADSAKNAPADTIALGQKRTVLTRPPVHPRRVGAFWCRQSAPQRHLVSRIDRVAK